MTDRDEQSAPRVALLDMTIQVDRNKLRSRRVRIEGMLTEYDWKVSTSISLLEFKATIIQQCITIHDQFCKREQFTLVRDSLIEKDHPQVSLRMHIFNNLVKVHASSGDLSPDEESLLARKARQNLENIIPRLYQWFRRSVDAVLDDEIKCTRAAEPPKRQTKAFGVNVPHCHRGKNKFCRIEQFIRDQAPALLAKLRSLTHASGQIEAARSLFESVMDHPQRELSNDDCRRAGDCLIALEGREHATHALSTNASEWSALSQAMGFQFVKVEYPEERTR